jgi:DNA-binding IclR family transcriptional regulator
MSTNIERTLRLLDLIAGEDGEASLTDLAARLDTSVASVSRTVQALRDAGAVDKDEETGRLYPSLSFWQLGAAALRRLDFRRIVVPALAAAVPELGKPIVLGVPLQDNALWLETVNVTGRFVMSNPVGQPIPYHATTMGKAMLAFLPEERRRRLIERGLTRYTAGTITDPRELERELDGIRDCGCALNRGEFRLNGLAVAVPLLSQDGHPIAAFSTPASEPDLDPRAPMARTLVNLGRSISEQLGYSLNSHDSFV